MRADEADSTRSNRLFFFVLNWQLALLRQIVAKDVAASARVVMIGDPVAERIFPDAGLLLAGGLAGAASGLAAAVIAHSRIGMRIEVTPEPLVLAFALSCLVGLTFGIYPAWQASKKSPLESLRQD
ncbi:ABC transporter permease [Paracoccus tibetensis]|uniref:FtsX-like permease family protein n=1 Tax=Paracoccus tibetensis TaxID=336292 RepID=A0A1G5B6L1_9RHOB|nr:ABC transporter permease [Paracoccus tibetensis]SCX85736.1 hypothetical protein SAMN05660710_00015 [Paracoccus tibetensis]